MKTRENAIVDGFDYQIPVTNLKGLKGDDQEYIYFTGSETLPSTCTYFLTNLVAYFPTNLICVFNTFRRI